jgi:hypothetical protein
MAELERALAALAAAEHAEAATPAAAPSAASAAAGCIMVPGSACAAAAAAAEGMVLYKLFKVYQEAQGLFRMKDKISRFSEWPQLQVTTSSTNMSHFTNGLVHPCHALFDSPPAGSLWNCAAVKQAGASKSRP